MKTLFILISTIVALFVGLLPEMAMYGLWNLISPVTEFGKILTVALFLTFGGGLSVLFGILGFVIWVAFVGAALESNF